MKKSSNHKIFFSIIFAIFISIIGYYLSKGNSELNQNNLNSNNYINHKSNSNFGSIIYLVKNTEGNNIYKLENNKPKLIFSDNSNDLKIQSINGITKNGKILVSMAKDNQEFAKDLYLVDINNKEQSQKLINEFASTQPPLISPDGTKIAYIIFSNVETDYGFSLYIMNTNGSNKHKISSNPIGIRLLSWNEDSSEILYLKDESQNESNIYKSNIKNAKEEKVITFKEKIYWLDWKQSKFVISKGPFDVTNINKSEIYISDETGKNIKRLTTDDKFDGYCFFDSKHNNVIYLKNEYSNNIDINKSGIINVISLDDGKISSYEQANTIIGLYN